MVGPLQGKVSALAACQVQLFGLVVVLLCVVAKIAPQRIVEKRAPSRWSLDSPALG